MFDFIHYHLFYQNVLYYGLCDRAKLLFPCTAIFGICIQDFSVFHVDSEVHNTFWNKQNKKQPLCSSSICKNFYTFSLISIFLTKFSEHQNFSKLFPRIQHFGVFVWVNFGVLCYVSQGFIFCNFGPLYKTGTYFMSCNI